jgi:hypothetical protein
MITSLHDLSPRAGTASGYAARRFRNIAPPWSLHSVNSLMMDPPVELLDPAMAV